MKMGRKRAVQTESMAKRPSLEWERERVGRRC